MEKPQTSIKDGEVVIIPTKTKFSKKYSAKSNPKEFDLDTVDESIVEGDGINFDKEDIRRNLTLFLYPDDSDYQGQLLRIYQQYFIFWLFKHQFIGTIHPTRACTYNNTIIFFTQNLHLLFS